MEHPDPTRLAIRATLHCLTGCAIGEILGTVIGSSLGWHNFASAALGIILAFVFGYGLTMLPLLRAGLQLRQAISTALASDSLSITSMEIVDTLIILIIPGAMNAGPTKLLFWSSLILSLLIAFAVTVPVNRWLIIRGKGHAHHH